MNEVERFSLFNEVDRFYKDSRVSNWEWHAFIQPLLISANPTATNDNSNELVDAVMSFSTKSESVINVVLRILKTTLSWNNHS
jgi:hypothetical protein